VERKTVIRRAAWIGALLLVTGVAVGLVATREVIRSDNFVHGERQQWREQLATEDQALLESMAKKIEGLPIDPKVVADIQTTHFRLRPERALYFWATGNDGQFLFGVPGDAFARLNTVFDQSQEVIAQDNRYATRDQFLRALLHTEKAISPVKPRPAESGSRASEDRDRDGGRDDRDWWRHYDEGQNRQYGGTVLFLSSPIRATSGAIIGNLNLKAVEMGRGPVYQEQRRDAWQVAQAVSAGLAAVSVFWLLFLIPSWVYIDAQERGLPRPLLWALLVVVGNLVGLLVYLISRPDETADPRCPQCTQKVTGTKSGCPYCGADLSAAFCRKCQFPVKPDWRFCPDCRASLAREVPVAAPAEPDPTTS
jgi:hypothetical protein